MHTSRLTPRWSDLDAAGHVNNATYLTLMEQARVELLAEIGAADWSEAGPVVAEATIRYLRPITRAAPVEVTVEVAEPGRTSVQTTQAVREPDAEGG